MCQPFTGSKGCKINRVDVSGCAADAETCNFVRGKTVNMTLQFTTSMCQLGTCDDTKYCYLVDQQISTLEAVLQGNIAGTWVPFSREQACSHIKPPCPIKANVMATYTLSLAISELYPTVSDDSSCTNGC